MNLTLRRAASVASHLTLRPDLLKLVHPEDAAGVAAVGAHFLSEAGGEAGVADGQILRLEPLVPQEGGDGLLRGGNEVFLVDGAVVRLLAAFADDLMETQKISSGERNDQTASKITWRKLLKSILDCSLGVLVEN